MVLRPVVASMPPGEACISAWPAIERTQRRQAAEYWLITQPDHAALSGALARNFISAAFPPVDAEIARAIELHDAGWAIFAPEARLDAAPAANAAGKPVSFLEIEPADFLRAWDASIGGAEAVCAAGGYIVSRHFCVLGEGRLAAAFDNSEDTARLRHFLSSESERQQRLRLESGRVTAELEQLLLVLQFCDLLSLYLCCGASEDVEFPQAFAPGRVRLRREKEACLLDPSPFRAGGGVCAPVSFGVEARQYPVATPRTTTLAFIVC
jgi:hypothetical protein